MTARRPKRKGIPTAVMGIVRGRQRDLCRHCGEPLSQNAGDVTQYDHRPPLILRPVNSAGTDYEPPQLDPDYIEALHKPCHLQRTVGRKPGASKTGTTKGSDIWLKTKFARLEKPRKPRTTIKPRGFAEGRKMKIPSRPFPKR